MQDLKFDTEKMLNVIRSYITCNKELKEIKTNMNDALQGVKKGWQSEGGDKFFKKYEDQWIKGIDQYSQVLDHMSKLLEDCSVTFDNVIMQAGSTLRIE